MKNKKRKIKNKQRKKSFWVQLRDEFDFRAQSEKQGVSIWQLPGFLFIVMSFTVIGAMLSVFFVMKDTRAPEVVIFSELALVISFFIISYFIIKNVVAVVGRIINDFNLKKQAEDLGVSVWQTPSFLFFLMGLIIVVSMLAIYYTARNNDNPEVLIFSEIGVVLVLYTIGSFIIKNVETIAQANKMKSEFVSIASHQLKTPLTEVEWEIEMLLKNHIDNLDKKQLESFSVIRDANTKMKRLVSDLLNVSRIEQGRMILLKESVDMVELVERVIQNNKVLARGNKVDIRFIAPKKSRPVFCDKKKIELVVDNLISNGIKYTENGGRVYVRVRYDKEKAIVCVKDDGIGIPENQQMRVFEKFYRANNVVKYKTSGTGLGLYIAKSIVEYSGGKMWFESEEGLGSIFCFSLSYGKNNK